MAHIHKILLTLLVIVKLSNVSCEESNNKTEPTTSKIEEEELVQSESKDGKLEIIKRIKKVNPDGSYTIGYEADDGSFKIESRDVLGNIKGTYGFVDEGGEIKRVSYSSSNASDIFTKHEPVSVPHFPTQSVVQRIPKNDDKSSSTKKPSTQHSTTTLSPSTTPVSVIQSIARRRAHSTTAKPSYNNVENVRSTTKSNLVTYISAAPRVLLQRPSLASISATKPHTSESRSEGQISRPEVPDKPTEIPLFKNSQLNQFEDEKPVTEETSEDRTNIFRRLPPQVPRDSAFNAEEHVHSLQQSLGHNDVSDIYNNGVTSRPLFTTTRPNRLLPIISSTTSSPVAVPKPTSNYVANYRRNQLQQIDSDTAAYSPTTKEIATSTEPVVTSTNIPVVQIPANRAASPEPLVAIRHPFQEGAILVPLSELQNRIIPVENTQDVYNARRHYVEQQPRTIGDSPVEIERQNVKKVNPPALRPLPVQVDENGFIREMPPHVPTPYPLPIPVTPAPVQIKTIRVPPLHENEIANNGADDNIENIHPPVSTKDFQKLLNHLIIRQKKLEKISQLTIPKQRPEQIEPEPVRYQRFMPASQPYYVQRVVSQRPEYKQQQQFLEIEQPQERSTTARYIAVRPEVRNRYHYQYRQENDANIEPKRAAATYERQQTYLTNRRTARLLPPGGVRQSQRGSVYVQEESETQTEEYLPPEVRETLLLRMLQLAINPALPLDDEEESQQLATSTAPQFKMAPVRNVEILGEEDDEVEVRKRGPVTRTKRYKEEDMEYME